MQKLYRVVLALLAFILSSISPLALAQNVRPWQLGKSYAVGSSVIYSGVAYKCLYAHTSVKDWEPPNVPALWQAEDARPNPASSLAPPARRMFAPYIDMNKPNANLPQIQAASGIKFFTLAFVISGGGCLPAWGGTAPVASDTTVASYVSGVRAASGDVIIAFGGYDGTELGMACPDAVSLRAAYQVVIDKYKAKMLDFDIEAAAIDNPASIDRRSQALKALAAANPGLQISFTLPVGPSGMPENAINVLKSAVTRGVPVSVVNLMTMDYGDPVPAGNMGPAAILAATASLAQMQSLGVQAHVGITPMLGVNDTTTETFTPADAQAVLSYAQSNSSVALLAFWSVGRDNGGCKGTVSPTCSGIAQQDWEFSKIFLKF